MVWWSGSKKCSSILFFQSVLLIWLLTWASDCSTLTSPWECKDLLLLIMATYGFLVSYLINVFPGFNIVWGVLDYISILSYKVGSKTMVLAPILGSFYSNSLRLYLVFCICLIDWCPITIGLLTSTPTLDPATVLFKPIVGMAFSMIFIFMSPCVEFLRDENCEWCMKLAMLSLSPL